MLNAQGLSHGGIMVNYACTAACRHCLYACSPSRTGGYISAEKTRTVCGLLRRGGCASVHIGGGEPFLDFDGLVMVIRELNKAGIGLEYVETNAYWSGSRDAAEKVKILMKEGVDALCISLDPFHAEYVPYGAPLRLARLCNELGMGYFLWKEQFLKSLSRLEPEKAHSRTEMEQQISPAYIRAAADAYGIRLGGRAVNIEGEYRPALPLDNILDKTPCHKLLSTGHFHVDLEGFFIPPGCTGIKVPLEEVAGGLPEKKYPVLEALYREGIGGLLELARPYGFSPESRGYPSKCNLCFHIRRFLAGKDFAELDGNYYEESLKYY
ncbi:MAG: radical SAM protein [Treponema sp.]|nr:radical SAM protein [Treponema sp.]